MNISPSRFILIYIWYKIKFCSDINVVVLSKIKNNLYKVVCSSFSYVDRFPRPGETMTGNHFAKGFGGKAANQCVMAMKLGVATGIIAMVRSWILLIFIIHILTLYN